MKLVAGVETIEPGDPAVVVHGDHGEFASKVTVVAIVAGGRTAEVRNEWGATYRCPVSWLSIVDPRHLARRTDPATSHIAARAQLDRLTSGQHKVLAALASAGDHGMIDHDHQAVNGLIQTSAGKRRGELTKAGLVIDTGRTRLSPVGSPAAVWKITPAGIAYLELLARRGGAA